MKRIKQYCNAGYRLYADTTLTFKIYRDSQILLLIFCYFLGNPSTYTQFDLLLIIQNHQYWRLLTSIIHVFPINAITIIFTLFCLWATSKALINLEERYSTLYVIFQIPKQILLANLTVAIWVYPMAVLGMVQARNVLYGGIIFTMLILVIFDACTDPNGYFKICQHNFILSRKYFPLIIILCILSLFRIQLIVLFIVLLFTFYQYCWRNKPLFAFPLNFYLKINQYLPLRLKQLHGYIDCNNVIDNLDKVCQEWFVNQNQQKQQINTVASIRQTLNIKNNQQKAYQHHWNNIQMPEIKEENTKEHEQSHQKTEKQEEQQQIGEKQAPQTHDIKNYKEVWSNKEQSEVQKPKKFISDEQLNIIQSNHRQEYHQQNQDAIPQEYEQISPKKKSSKQLDADRLPPDPSSRQQKPDKAIPKAVSAMDDDEQWY